MAATDWTPFIPFCCTSAANPRFFQYHLRHTDCILRERMAWFAPTGNLSYPADRNFVFPAGESETTMSGLASDVDRAMLWLAARPAGRQEAAQEAATYSSDAWLTGWNPLDDNGDAQSLLLALARYEETDVGLQIAVGPTGPDHVSVTQGGTETIRERIAEDLGTATRRAIVRAAAQSGLEHLTDAERTSLMPYTRETAFVTIGTRLAESLGQARQQAPASHAHKASVSAHKASSDEAEDLELTLRGKRLYGRGLIGLSSHLIDELFDVARTHGYRLLMLAGDPQWVRQEYLIVHPDDIPLLPRNVGDPYFALSGGQGFAVFPINPKILLQPFNVMRLS